MKLLGITVLVQENPDDMESVIAHKLILQLEHVHFSYPGQVVFNNVCAHIPPGLTVIQGDESTGKTTLLNLITGKWTVSSGVIRTPLLGLPDNAPLLKHHYFLVGDDAEDWESRTPRAFFEHCQSKYGMVDSQVLEELVEAFGLREHVEKNMFMLSRGSKRKVWLVAAFAAGAPITLMDDPFIALDHQSVCLLKDLINETAEWKDKALIITQHVGDAELNPTHLIDLNKAHS